MNEYINKIDNKIKNHPLKKLIKITLTEWFISLNKNDLNILIILGTYIAFRINKLFIEQNENDEIYITQYYNNNKRDLKAIILLLLPYINDEKINVYAKINDLNELILNNKLPSDFLEQDRTTILNNNFKYTNVGLGLFIDNKLDLFDKEFDKLIYKLIYYNCIALDETLSIISGKLYICCLIFFI
jgi:hypothetical protein